MNHTEMKPEEFIGKVLSDVSMTPCLLIGRYVNEFKRIYDGYILRAYTLSDVDYIIEEYDGIESVNSEFLVLEGVGSLSMTGQNSLLKFIEESKLPIILLSYNDRVIDTIRSRMKIVAKLWYPVKNFNFSRVKDAQNALNEKKKDGEFKGNAEIQFMADNCPRLYALRESSGDLYDFNNQRMLNLMTMNAR